MFSVPQVILFSQVGYSRQGACIAHASPSSIFSIPHGPLSPPVVVPNADPGITPEHCQISPPKTLKSKNFNSSQVCFVNSIIFILEIIQEKQFALKKQSTIEGFFFYSANHLGISHTSPAASLFAIGLVFCTSNLFSADCLFVQTQTPDYNLSNWRSSPL